MDLNQIDPQFHAYLRDPPRLSYTDPEDPWLSRSLVSALEVMMGRRRIEDIYYRLKADNPDTLRFFEHGLSAANIQVRYEAQRLAAIPSQGPLMFVANHPYGIVDGMVLCDLAMKARGDMRIMINSLLCQDQQLAPYFLPIDFQESRQALKTNIRSKQLALENLARGIPVLIFPSGMVSTADRLGFGAVNDGPWSTFAAKIIKEAQATVVPVYFHGQNSRKFHIASHIAAPLRMALLVHEALKKVGATIEVEIGAPLAWEQLQEQGGRRQLTQFLYNEVQALGRSASGPGHSRLQAN